MQVVEREVLDKLLAELQLSSSELANPETALRIGRILSARLISTGSIVKEGSEWLVNLRIIETETTSIKIAIAETLKAKNREDVSGRLSAEIVKGFKAEYPLQGIVRSSEGEGRRWPSHRSPFHNPP